MDTAIDKSNPENENPLKYRYMRTLRLFSYCLGIWPGNMLDEKMSKFYDYFIKLVPLQAIIVFMGEIYYLARVLYPNLKFYGVIWRRFIKEFHLGNFMQCGGNYKKVADRINKISNYYTLGMIPIIWLGVILFNLSPFWTNVTSGAFQNPRPQNITLRFSVYYEYPGFKPEENFILVTLLNLYFSYACTVIVCTLDLLLILMCFQIVGHQLVLQYNLDDFPKPKKISVLHLTGEVSVTVEKYSIDENAYIHCLLMENVLHHRYILCFVDDISSFFGPMMGLVYFFDVTGFCLLFLECSQLNSESLARFGPLTIIAVSQLLEISIIFEIVGSMSEQLKDNVYNLPWQCMDLKNQKTLLIFLNRIQTTMHITCMGVLPVGVQSMASILKTCYSYFTILQSMDI
ncbi:unnamed protein product [Pieris macdunnoughi]|uniref:Odorant receptor n=1 Tax=Pieris macdunnoughi TaxID=345717 RepID=A0A821L1R5_9NEOP|nr:unnamed protein product [Pieris macdunnoughi]